MEQHNTTTTGTDRRDLAGRAAEQATQGNWRRAVNLYYQAADHHTEAARVLCQAGQDYWCRKAATAAREAANEAHRLTEERVGADGVWYRECREEADYALRWAAQAEGMARESELEQAHTWA